MCIRDRSFFHGRISFIVWNGLLIGFTTLAAFVVGAMKYSGSHDLSVLMVGGLDAGTYRHAQTMAFVVLSVSQLLFSLSLRSEKQSIFKVGLFGNKYLWGAIILGICIQDVYKRQVYRQIAYSQLSKEELDNE